MNIKEVLCELCTAPGVAGINDAAQKVTDILLHYADEVAVENGSVYGVIKGEDSNHTILLDAHIDEIAMLVTSVLDNGFVKVAAVGGIDVRTLGAQRVTVWGREPVTGVFCSTPPHLKKEEAGELKLSEMSIDTCCDNAKELISPGDAVTFKTVPAELMNGGFTCKSVDNRAGVAALLYAAELVANSENKPPVNVAFLFSDKEEIGGMGAKTMTFDNFPDEAIAVDVGFGDYPGLSEEETCELGKGTMIGFSPALSRDITLKLRTIAEEENIPYQYDVMGGRTGTNADQIAVAKSGVPCGLLSIPIRSMHTTVESVNIDDIISTGRLLAAYVMKAGVCK